MKVSNAADVARLLEEQIARITQPDLLELINRLRVTPRCEMRPWDYGKADEAYPCWIVLKHPQSDTGIAYCEEGFGPRCPWGLLWLTKYPNIGMDSGWFVTLEDAVRQCMAWQGENPPGYEIQ